MPKLVVLICRCSTSFGFDVVKPLCQFENYVIPSCGSLRIKRPTLFCKGTTWL